MNRRPVIFGTAAIFGLLSAAGAFAQDVLQLHVTYVCNGEKIFLDSCNIRDISDTSKCMVAHPDTILPNGLMKYTWETRGDLKKLLPTCKQPSAEERAREAAFDKKVQDKQDALQKKAEDDLRAQEARQEELITGKKPLSPEERALNRCITAGRLPASCTGNSLLGGFTQMIGQVLPDLAKEAPPGPNMAGVFQGPGNWRIDFITDGVLVNCSMLAPDQHNYTIQFKGQHPAIVIDTTPKPLVLTLLPDGTIVAPGPVVIDGVIASGYAEGTTTTTHYGPSAVSMDSAGNKYDVYGNRVYGDNTITTTTPGHATFTPKRTTCPALNLTTKGAGVGVETMQTDLLKSMFGGDKGPPTPPGIRMHGIFAASTGFSAQFFPESVILGCGPDAARAYPYSVVAEGGKAVIHVAAPDQPLTFALRPDGSLDPGSTGAYQVHGRVITGQNSDSDFTFGPLERTCNLAVLAPGKTIPSNGGAATMTATAPSGAAGSAGGPVLSPPNAPLGNAVLTIVSGIPAQPNAMNPLAGYPYVLTRDSFANAVIKSGVQVPPGTPPLKVYAQACQSHSPNCQKVVQTWKATAVSVVRGDVTGKATLPGVPPGTYYLMISIRHNNQPTLWDLKLDLKPGANTLTVDQRNAVPVK
jgi:hypothetical protein